jgi:hypothetical protein
MLKFTNFVMQLDASGANPLEKVTDDLVLHSYEIYVTKRFLSASD